MKTIIAFAAILAVTSAQFPLFGSQQSRYNPRPPVPRPSNPAPRPQALAASRPSSGDRDAQTLRLDSNIAPDGAYDYAVETSNGISAQAQGTPRDFGGNPPVIPVVASGSFAWTSPEGQPIAISYIADENGYQPSGDAIPTPPPVPEAILRSLQYLSRAQK